MKTIITKIKCGQPDLAVKLVEPGCNGGQLVDWKKIRLVISAPDCKHLLKSPLVFCGCWPGYKTPWTDQTQPHELPMLVYPAFGTDEKGAIVFRFDKLLWGYPPGRYIGRVEVEDGRVLSILEIDLCASPVLIDTVSYSEQSCG